MPNIKSQKKRALTNLKRQEAAKADKTALKTAIKNVLSACEAKDKDKAAAAFNQVSKQLDEAVASGIKDANYAARQKSRLSKAVNKIGQ